MSFPPSLNLFLNFHFRCYLFINTALEFPANFICSILIVFKIATYALYTFCGGNGVALISAKDYSKPLI